MRFDHRKLGKGVGLESCALVALDLDALSGELELLSLKNGLAQGIARRLGIFAPGDGNR